MHTGTRAGVDLDERSSDFALARFTIRNAARTAHGASVRVRVRMIPRAMPEHVHVHVPHELAEPAETTTVRERWLEILAALLLSLATLGIAWSGYQAAKWSGLQARRYTQASTARSLANRSATLASQDRTQDLLNFNRWLEVSTEGDTQLADLYQRRFRDEFRPAFDRWLADDPMHNPNAVPSPLREKNYVLANEVKADRLEKLGDLRFEQGKEATENADDYVFITVFFAVVLFFAGISLRFRWFPMRVLIMALGAVLLLWGGWRLLDLPTL
jgi:protein-S-isoprenylcysteine O-methyltransferase Ste14